MELFMETNNNDISCFSFATATKSRDKTKWLMPYMDAFSHRNYRESMLSLL